MGWKEGQGIGPRRRGEIHSGASLLRISQQAVEPMLSRKSNTGDDKAEPNTQITFAAPTVAIRIPPSKLDSFGIGYIRSADEAFMRRKSASGADDHRIAGRGRIDMNAEIGGQRKRARRAATRSGLLSNISGYDDSDDDDAAFGDDDMDDYDTSWGKSRTGRRENRAGDVSENDSDTESRAQTKVTDPRLLYTSDRTRVIVGFVVGSEVARCLPLESYFPHAPPPSFVPNPLRVFGGVQQKSSTNDSSNNELMNAFAVHQLKNLKQSGQGGVSLVRAQILNENVLSSTEKQPPTSLSTERPMLTSATMQSTFAGLSQAFKNRFVSSSTAPRSDTVPDQKMSSSQPLTAQHTLDSLPSLLPGLSSGAEYAKLVSSLQPQQDSASTENDKKSRKFIPSRITIFWDPAPLLCKRFNVPVPSTDAETRSKPTRPQSNMKANATRGVAFGAGNDAADDSYGHVAQPTQPRQPQIVGLSSREENLFHANIGKYLEPQHEALTVPPPSITPQAPEILSSLPSNSWPNHGSQPTVADNANVTLKPPMSLFKSIFEDSDSDDEEDVDGKSDKEEQNADNDGISPGQDLSQLGERENNATVVLDSVSDMTSQPTQSQISSYLQTMASYTDSVPASSDLLGGYGSYLPLPKSATVGADSAGGPPAKILFRRPLKKGGLSASEQANSFTGSKELTESSTRPSADAHTDAAMPVAVDDEYVADFIIKQARLATYPLVGGHGKADNGFGDVDESTMGMQKLADEHDQQQNKRKFDSVAKASAANTERKGRKRFSGDDDDDEENESGVVSSGYFRNPHAPQTFMHLSSTLSKVQSALSGEAAREPKKSKKQKGEKKSKKAKEESKSKSEVKTEKKSKKSKKSKKGDKEKDKKDSKRKDKHKAKHNDKEDERKISAGQLTSPGNDKLGLGSFQLTENGITYSDRHQQPKDDEESMGSDDGHSSDFDSSTDSE
jgi:hypothetical protein